MNSAPITFDSLPAVRPGHYSWCLYKSPETDQFKLVWYDDDTDTEDAAVIYRFGYHTTASYTDLRALPSFLDLPAQMALGSSPKSNKDGLVYAVALIPNIDLRHLKIGFTINIKRRLRTFRTTSPGASILGLWDADTSDEKQIHRQLTGQIGTSEVFHCKNPWRTIAQISDWFAEQTQP